jgi:hypothetical protein
MRGRSVRIVRLGERANARQKSSPGSRAEMGQLPHQHAADVLNGLVGPG